MFYSSHTEGLVLETILSANGAMQRQGKTISAKTNYMWYCASKKEMSKCQETYKFTGQLHNTLSTALSYILKSPSASNIGLYRYQQVNKKVKTIQKCLEGIKYMFNIGDQEKTAKFVSHTMKILFLNLSIYWHSGRSLLLPLLLPR